MKRAKSVVTFLTATSLLFGASTISFAQETEKTTDSTVLISTEAAEKLLYASKDYFVSSGEIIGSYPAFENMSDLSNKIYSDIENFIVGLNLNDDDENNLVVGYSVDENQGNFAIVTVKVEENSVTNNFVYYVDKSAKKEITKEEFDKATTAEEVTTESSLEITMVPLRTNAEKKGWKVNWEQKTETEPSKAILTKDNESIKILVDATTNYDLIINKDVTKSVVSTDKLDKPVELQDSTLYVPSTFFDKILGK